MGKRVFIRIATFDFKLTSYEDVKCVISSSFDEGNNPVFTFGEARFDQETSSCHVAAFYYNVINWDMGFRLQFLE